MRKVIRTVLIVVLIAAMVALVAKRKRALKNVPAYGLRPVTVHTVEAQKGNLSKTHSYLGTVESWQVAKVSSRISAKVDKITLDEGDTVKKGDLLLQLDDSDIQAQLKALDSTIKGLETNKKFWTSEDERDQKLAKEGVISAVEAEATHNKMTDAVAKLYAMRLNRDSLLNKLTYTKLTSPFDGVVTARNVDPGDLAVPGKPLLVVEDHSAFKIAFDAPQADIIFLKVGMPVIVTANNKELNLKITTIYPSLNHAKMVHIEIKAPADAPLQLGSFVPLKVIWLQHENVTVVPVQSIMENSSGALYVFTVQNDKLQLHQVKKIMKSEGKAEVTGIEPGAQVITSTFLGWANLSDGLKVEVAK